MRHALVPVHLIRQARAAAHAGQDQTHDAPAEAPFAEAPFAETPFAGRVATRRRPRRLATLARRARA